MGEGLGSEPIPHSTPAILERERGPAVFSYKKVQVKRSTVASTATLVNSCEQLSRKRVGNQSLLALVIGAVLFVGPSSRAQTYRLDQKELPLLEAGVGLGYANLPYYPGSSQRRNFVLPVPVFVYRGDLFRADEDGGPRGRFFANRRWEFNASFGVTLPVSEDEAPLREGMEDLDFIFEIGPGVIYHIIPKDKDKRWALSLNFAIRLPVATNGSRFRQQGVVFNPVLFSWYRWSQNLTMFNSLSGVFSSQRHQAFFYDVRGSEELSDRPAFQSEAGLLALGLSQFMIWNINPTWSIFGGAVYRNYSFTANRDSPLHEEDSTFSVVVGFSFWFYQSAEKRRFEKIVSP